VKAEVLISMPFLATKTPTWGFGDKHPKGSSKIVKISHES
jgi:hypothetical protein